MTHAFFPFGFARLPLSLFSNDDLVSLPDFDVAALLCGRRVREVAAVKCSAGVCEAQRRGGISRVKCGGKQRVCVRACVG